MNKEIPSRYFLGANSRSGFYSLYDSFIDPAAGDFLWVIKGGPGCGKSTFMGRIGAAAEEAGVPVEYIHCSGDPDSLDAVWFPTLRTGYVDGTAPHVQEAVYPGAASLYLDLGAFLDAGALEPHLTEIADLNRRYKALYADAYTQLAAGASLLPKNFPGLCGSEEQEKIEKKLSGLAARELRKRCKHAKLTHRFLSAYSCRGRVRLEETLTARCSRVYALDNELGLAHSYLTGVANLAVAQGYDAVVCHDPLEPEKLEAVLLPEADLAFAATDKTAPLAGKYRHLRLDTLADDERLTAVRPMLRQRRKKSNMLLHSAMDTLAAAKALHDELEHVYHPYVDFSGVSALAADHIQWLLGK